jgi:hypothetical protein
MLNILLGSEDDDDLFDRLLVAVKDMGGSIVDTEWILGGSQELTRYSITLPAGNLEALAETYIGLTLCGNPDLVRLLASKVVPNIPSQSTK